MFTMTCFRHIYLIWFIQRGPKVSTHYTYVGLNTNSSVTECPLPNRNNSFWYDLLPPLVRGICQIKTYLCSCFSNEGSFSHLFDSLDRVNFYWIMFGHSNYVCTEKPRVLASQMTEILSLTRLFITCDQVIGLRLDPHYGKCAESPITVP